VSDDFFPVQIDNHAIVAANHEDQLLELAGILNRKRMTKTGRDRFLLWITAKAQRTTDVRFSIPERSHAGLPLRIVKLRLKPVGRHGMQAILKPPAGLVSKGDQSRFRPYQRGKNR